MFGGKAESLKKRLFQARLNYTSIENFLKSENNIATLCLMCSFFTFAVDGVETWANNNRS